MRGSGFLALVIASGLFILIFFLVTMLYAYLFSRATRAPLFRDFYECGFRALPDGRIGIDIQYSALLLIFLIFDMEIVILVPLCLNALHTSLSLYILLFVALLILGLSYWYEWDRYTLQWSFN